MTDAHVRWRGQGEALFLSLAKDAVVLRSTVPSPPGSRLEGTLAGATGETASAALVVRIKVHGCKKQGGASSSGDFVLEGRLLDATREVRAAIAARVAEPAP